MNDDTLKTPSGLVLHDGTIVMLARFPGTKWVVRNGKYTHQGKKKFGWYFSSIPANTIIPVNPDDLVMLVIVSDDRCWGCIPDPEPSPSPSPILKELDKTFITVKNNKELKKLYKMSLIPDGKLVRVNHVYNENKEDTGAHYYRYDADLDEFIEIFIENEVSGEEFTELKESVEVLYNAAEWVYLT